VSGNAIDQSPTLFPGFGYPFALLMVLISATLYSVFKGRGWL
jgi:hypothetical protein